MIMTFKGSMDHLVWCIIGLIAYASVDTATEYGDSLHYHDEAVNFTSSKASTYYLVGSTVNSSDKLVSLIRHAATQLPDEDSEAESVRVTVLGQCDDFAHSTTDDDEDDEIVIKSNRFELLALGSIIATFAVVLLLATCLLVTLLNRFAGGAVVYEYEQSKCISPAAVRRRPGVEDVLFSQSSYEYSVPSRQVSKKKSSKSYLRILSKLSATVQINQRLIKLLITITSSALESKTNTASLENELIELQRNMDKVQKNNSRLKNHAQKFKMKSDHHKRQESYLEDRCEELKKHNEHLMNFFKMINKQKTRDHVDEALTDEDYPVQEENPCHQK